MLDTIEQFNLQVNRLHVRYEDDYFAEEGKPFSFGLLADKFSFKTPEANAGKTNPVIK
jgi:hypothetical protein